MSLSDKIKRSIRDLLVKVNFLRRPSIRYCIENELLPSLFVRTPSNSIKKLFNLPPSEYQTQLNQDVFALLINQFKPGFFLEIGANDGFTISNTVYLEKNFGWKGILVEANSKYLDSLAGRTNSLIVNKAVSSQKGKAEFIDAGLYGGLKSGLDTTHYSFTKDAACITVDCATLQEILDEADAPEQIDFISLDVEGSEVPIVDQMVAVNRRFKCGCIEFNKRKEDYARMVALLESDGYQVLWADQTETDLFFIDIHPSKVK